MAKRLYKSLISIPIWLITGLSLFLIFSSSYDLMVGDRTTSRYLVLGASGLILLITIFLNSVKLKTIGNIARRQLGG